MEQSISKRVGKGTFLPMSDANVQKVIELLSGVPAEEGGAAGLLKPPVRREQLVAAICGFQAYQFGQVTGFVDPDNVTIRRLELYASGARPGPDSVSALIKLQRQEIVRQAQTMVGKVSNTQLDPRTHERHGWAELWEIFDTAGIPVESEAESVQRKSLAKFTLPAGNRIPFDHFKYVRKGTPGIAWCGIFATWALNRAGFNFKWVLNKGIRHWDGAVLPVADGAGVTLGDICVVNDKHVSAVDQSGELGLTLRAQYLAHHIIVASHPTIHGTIDVIEGNYPHLTYGGHSIVDDSCRMPQGKRNVREIIHRYELFRPLSL